MLNILYYGLFNSQVLTGLNNDFQILKPFCVKFIPL